MAKPPRIYRRLPGRGATLTHYVRLFQGPDHLLQVSSTGYSEVYKRFYFRDIQAITMQKTGWGLFGTILLGFFVVLFALPALFASGGAAMFLWIMAAICLLFLLVHLILGPTCACHIRTAVQIEKLPTLRRVKVARRTVNRLRPLIAAVQGQLSAEEIVQKAQAALPTAGFQGANPAVEVLARPAIVASDRPNP